MFSLLVFLIINIYFNIPAVGSLADLSLFVGPVVPALAVLAVVSVFAVPVSTILVVVAVPTTEE
jgi:hypothetical protein